MKNILFAFLLWIPAAIALALLAILFPVVYLWVMIERKEK